MELVVLFTRYASTTRSELTVEKAKDYTILVQRTDTYTIADCLSGIRSDSCAGPGNSYQRHDCAYPCNTESRRSSALCQELRLDILFKLRSSTCT
jgi:hypothetical protein